MTIAARPASHETALASSALAPLPQVDLRLRLARRTQISQAVALSEQTSRAAASLWSEGSVALAIALLADDFARLLDAVREQSRSDSAPLETMAELEETDRLRAALTLPRLDREFTEVHADLLARLDTGRRACVDLLGGRPWRARVLRGALLAAVALLAIGVCAKAVWPADQWATASAAYGDEYSPENVIDGIASTEWLLPGGQTGWIELQFRRPRSISAVHIKNAKNRSFRDRAAHEFTVEAYSDAELVGSTKAEFGPIDSDSGTREVALQARNVNRIRIAVLSYYGNGGGLAEVEVR